MHKLRVEERYQLNSFRLVCVSPPRCHATLPVSQFQVCSEHAADVGEMRNAGFRAEYAIRQFNDFKYEYEEPSRHRDRREKEYHDAT